MKLGKVNRKRDGKKGEGKDKEGQGESWEKRVAGKGDQGAKDFRKKMLQSSRAGFTMCPVRERKTRNPTRESEKTNEDNMEL